MSVSGRCYRLSIGADSCVRTSCASVRRDSPVRFPIAGGVDTVHGLAVDRARSDRCGTTNRSGTWRDTAVAQSCRAGVSADSASRCHGSNRTGWPDASRGGTDTSGRSASLSKSQAGQQTQHQRTNKQSSHLDAPPLASLIHTRLFQRLRSSLHKPGKTAFGAQQDGCKARARAPKKKTLELAGSGIFWGMELLRETGKYTRLALGGLRVWPGTKTPCGLYVRPPLPANCPGP